jgi:hypothetical protein
MTEEQEKTRIQIRLLRFRHDDLMTRPLDPKFPEESMRAMSEEITELAFEIKRLEATL